MSTGNGVSFSRRLVERRIFVFTDFDGALLDPIDYGWEAATSTLAYLRQQHIPLIPCTSKTRAEVESLRRKMGHKDPYIAESGGILVLPWKFLHRGRSRKARERDLVLQPGGCSTDAHEALKKLASQTNVTVRSLQEMTVEDITSVTGLTSTQARRSRMREASAPFQFLGASKLQIREFRRAARQHGFRTAEGARFWHLTRGVDKGRTMGLLIQLAKMIAGTGIVTIAAGDAKIDIPMLRRAEVPILMPGADGRVAQDLLRTLPHALCAAEPGPAGWANAVRQAIAYCEVVSPKSRRPAVAADARQVPVLHEVFLSLVRGSLALPRATRKIAALP